jgi:hypothetical protein
MSLQVASLLSTSGALALITEPNQGEVFRHQQLKLPCYVQTSLPLVAEGSRTGLALIPRDVRIGRCCSHPACCGEY